MTKLRTVTMREPGFELFKGSLPAREGSWARFSRTSSGWQGLVWDGSTLYGVEPAARLHGMTDIPIQSSSEMLIFRVDDIRIPEGTMRCGVTPGAATQTGANFNFKALTEHLKSTVSQSLDIALIGDASFSSRHSSDPVGALAARLNNIDGIYTDQLGITLNVTEFRAFDSSSDPLTVSTDGNTLLEDLGIYKLTEPALQSLGLVLLYTGRNLDGTTVGISYRRSLCSSRFGVGLSEARSTLTTDSLIGAHEIGHIFGAPHDGESGSACESTPRTFLMAPNVNGSSTFSACSLEQMQPEIDSASCLKTVQSVDVGIDLMPSATTVNERDSFSMTVVIANEGADPAEGVTARVDIPPSVTLLDAGSFCVSSAGGVDCDVGSVAAGSEVTTMLNLEARQAGTADFSASVAAAGDANTANDSATAQVTINALVDVAISLSGPTTLTEGEEADFQIAVENLSSTPATSLQLDFSIPGLVSATTVSASTGSCNLVATGASCSLPELGASGTLSVTVGLRAETAGTAALEGEVAAAETDPDATNNVASLALEISAGGTAPPDPTPPPDPAPTPDSGGGGGGHGLWLLVVACIGPLVRRQRSRAGDRHAA